MGGHGPVDNFPEQYEQQKIPEWHTSYIDYNLLKKKLREFDAMK